MSINTNLPRSEVIPGWSFHLMRYSWKVTDLFNKPSNQLNEYKIEPGWTVIDYGCGPGRYLKKASEQVGPEGMVYAVDIHDIAIECSRNLIHKHKLGNVFPLQAMDYFVPIPEDTADLIYVLDVFHMVSKPVLFLQELHRLVKVNGRLILEDGHQKRSKTISKVMASKRWKIEYETKRHLELSPIYKLTI